MLAMMLASKEVVSMLLKFGANPMSVDVIGIDSSMYAAICGRSDNIEMWLSQFPGWNFSRGATVNGATALHCAVYFGQNKLNTVRLLVESGADIFLRNDGGASILMNVANNEDSDPSVLRYLLRVLKLVYSEESLISELNYRRRAKSLKWKGIYMAMKVLHRSKLSKAGFVESLAQDPATTALNYAVVRGDVEIVKILLENGADPYVENDLGMNAFEICEKFGPFPSVRKVLWEHVRSS